MIRSPVEPIQFPRNTDQ